MSDHLECTAIKYKKRSTTFYRILFFSAALSTTFNSKCKNGRQGRGADEEEDRYIQVGSSRKRQYVKVRETQFG